MRVISGKYRGIRLYTPQDDKIRPTTDRIKEDIFNILSPYTYDADFLDLFGGTGQIAIEAISRGARSAVILDKDDVSVRLIKKNVALTKDENIKVLRRDALNFVIETKDAYDIIYIDPPYALGQPVDLIDRILKKGIIRDGGVVVVEMDIKTPMLDEEKYSCLKLFKTKKYSLTALYFYEYSEN